MFKDMVNIVFLAVAVILSLPAKLLGDISSFFYGCSRALDNNDEQGDIDNGSI